MKEVNEKQKEILRECVTPRRNKWLKENLIKNPTWLSKYLKDLQLRGYLTRNIKNREYQTTQDGLKFLHQAGIIADLSTSTMRTPIESELPRGKSLPQHKLSIDYPVPLLPKPEQATIDGFWYIDEGHKNKYTKIVQELKQSRVFEISMKHIFNSIGEALKKIYGCEDLSESFWGVTPYRYRSQHLAERISLDFKAGLVFRFDGRAVVQKIPWETILEDDAKYDLEFEKRWKRSKRAILKQKDYRRMWLESVVAEIADEVVAITEAKRERPRSLPEKLFEGIQAASKEEAERKFIEEVRQEKDRFPMSRGMAGRVRNHLPTEQDVKDVLDDFQREGILRVTSKTVTEWFFEIVDEDKLDAKSKKVWKELEKI